VVQVAVGRTKWASDHGSQLEHAGRCRLVVSVLHTEKLAASCFVETHQNFLAHQCGRSSQIAGRPG